MKGDLFLLGRRARGAARRRWQVQYCADAAQAERIAAGLAGFAGGGRWRVYGFVRVRLPDGTVRLDRGDLLAEGVVRPRRTSRATAEFNAGTTRTSPPHPAAKPPPSRPRRTVYRGDHGSDDRSAGTGDRPPP